MTTATRTQEGEVYTRTFFFTGLKTEFSQKFYGLCNYKIHNRLENKSGNIGVTFFPLCLYLCMVSSHLVADFSLSSPILSWNLVEITLFDFHAISTNELLLFAFLSCDAVQQKQWNIFRIIATSREEHDIVPGGAALLSGKCLF